MAQRRNASELPLSLEPRTLFVTGKGGVGKSTVAATLALAFRDAGVRTLLVQIEGQSPASQLLSDRQVGYEPTALSPSLWSLTIDADNALREYARLRLKVPFVADKLVGNPIFHQFAQAAPGFKELLVLGKLWALAKAQNSRRKPQFEAIIVDAPATGHGVGLLGMAGVVARMFPVGPIAAEAREVDAFVRDPGQTGVVVVALPEEMPVNEAIELGGRLGEQGVDVSAVVLNGLLPERIGHDDVPAIEAALAEPDVDPSVAAALETALYEHLRWDEQQAERQRLEDAMGSVHTLPYLYTHELTPEHVRDLARWLTPKGLRAQEARLRRAEAAAAKAGRG